MIPAYNEEATIERTLESLSAQTRSDLVKRILVVADHCSDRTADVAEARGVKVLRRDDGPPGKANSIRDAFRLLGAEACSDAVLVLDSDWTCEDAFIAEMSAMFDAGADVVQGRCAVEDPAVSPVHTALRLSYALRNHARPAGAAALGLPSGIFGTGMAFRWDATRAMTWGNSTGLKRHDRSPSGVDVAMWFDLLRSGYCPRLAEAARLQTFAPRTDSELAKQRLRWERGQVRSWLQAFDTAKVLMRRLDLRAAVALIDWSAPPLVPTVFAFTGLTAANLVAVVVVGVPRAILLLPSLAATLLVGYLVVGVTYLEGRQSALRLLVGAPSYVLWKVRAYVRALAPVCGA